VYFSDTISYYVYIHGIMGGGTGTEAVCVLQAGPETQRIRYDGPMGKAGSFVLS
jgi:hypothetical protein